MAHIHEQIDFAVGALIVHGGRVLFIHHKLFNMWFPPGGHVELHEDTDQALRREIKEETGLGIQLLNRKFDADEPGVKSLHTPDFMDIHQIGEGHRHIGMLYVATAVSDHVTLKPDEHYDIRWFTADEIQDPNFNTRQSVRAYALEALRRVASNTE